MKIIFLGTNGWYDTSLGNTICTLIKTQDFHIILDAGNGLYKIDRHIIDEKPVFLFLSHFHLDHIIGLHILNPEKAAELALNANAKRLALIHFDASIYPTIQQRTDAEFQAKKIFVNTFIALDDMEIEL